MVFFFSEENFYDYLLADLSVSGSNTCWDSYVDVFLLPLNLQENSENLLEVDQSDKKSEKSETVDLNDNVLQVDISDALSEREKVKFTIHTKVRWG